MKVEGGAELVVPLIVALLLLSAGAALAANDGLSASESDEGVLVTEGGQPVLFYQRQTKSFRGEVARAHYIHPLYGLDGEVFTEDFPPDHLHHRGLYTAWHQFSVDGKPAGDPWICKDFEYDVRSLEILRPDKARLSLAVRVWWRSPLVVDSDGIPVPLVQEETTIAVGAVRDDVREIDVDLQLRAMVANVRIGGSKGVKAYGGFSARMRLPEDIRFSGRAGKVVPQRTPLEAGPWIDMTASFGSEPGLSGVAILCHPQTPGKPHQWVLRQSGSMQNHVYPGRVPILLSQDEPLTLRYRLLIHRGEPDPAQIEERLRAYADQ